MSGAPRVQLLSHFGPPVQGLSPYADALLAALHAHGGVDVAPVGYRAAYPGWLHPAQAGAAAGTDGVHWADPRTWRRVADAPADVLHIQHWQPALAAYLAPLARQAARRGKRIVVTVHNPEPHEPLPGLRALERRLLDRADPLLVHDARGRDALLSRIGAARDVRVVAHGIDVAASPPAEREGDRALLGLEPGRRLVSLFGNLRGYKGVPVLLDAWARIAARHPDTDVVIAGRLWTGRGGLVTRAVARVLGTAGESARIAAAMAHPALAGRVHLREGFLPDAAIDALLRASALAVFPYERFASQSGAASRAGGQGVPMLVSDVGGLPRLAIGPGWIVPPGDAAALAAALDARLAEGPGAEARTSQLAALSEFAWPRVAAAHVDVYRSASPAG